LLVKLNGLATLVPFKVYTGPDFTRRKVKMSTQRPHESAEAVPKLNVVAAHTPSVIAERIVSERDTNYQSQSDEVAVASTPPTPSLTVANVLVNVLENLGVQSAFGVAGGAVASLWLSLSHSQKISVVHCRHEGGAAFAATEAHFASDLPTVVFTTAGPGITNALTGLLAAQGEGAKVILLSACTSAAQRGRGAIQETSIHSMPHSGIFTPGALFDYAMTLESPEELPQVARRLALGLAQPGSFVAHISIPTGVQSSLVSPAHMPTVSTLETVHSQQFQIMPNASAIAHCAQILASAPFAIWLGFGARLAAEPIRQLAERTGAAVMCSPRAKGIFPEDHPQFVGVTGVGGHESVLAYMREQPPVHTLVLGTRLGEPTSFWSAAMVPSGGFLHVDIDPNVPGVAYPLAPTLPIQAEINLFMTELLQHFPENLNPARTRLFPRPHIAILPSSNGSDSPLVRPEVLMDVIQRLVIDRSDAVVLAESGNSFTWATHRLRFSHPQRYRVSTGLGAMGHMVTGVVGLAQASKRKAVAITGDGSMLMNNEISTAVKHQVPAVWIVLNDARYNMCVQGMAMLGLKGADAMIPDTDFVAIAQGMGANGIRVHRESDLEQAFTQAMSATGPFVVDVLIDPERPAPSRGRNDSLIQLREPTNSAKQVSFPLTE
jgi:thiamine pyrophosphate-dependent acetolactate synthase large subunit-like protein